MTDEESRPAAGGPRWRAPALRGLALLVVLAATGLTVTRTWAAYPRVPESGYRLISSDGGVFSFNAPFVGSAAGVAQGRAVVVAAAGTPSGFGYWLVTADGEILAFGDARGLGSPPVDPDSPVVALAVTPSGSGYWVARADGAILAAGDAIHAGDEAGGPSTAVALEAAPDGRGYWLLRRDGTVSAFGSARLHPPVRGSGLGPEASRADAVDLAATPSGRGYWVVTATGQVRAFGDAGAHGSLHPSAPATTPVIGMLASRSGEGYVIVDTKGRAVAYGDAPALGGTQKLELDGEIVDVVGSPRPAP